MAGRTSSVKPGDKFNMMTVLGIAGRTAGGTILVECKCDCGNPKVKVVQLGSLRIGATKGCGCGRGRPRGRWGPEGNSKTPEYSGYKYAKRRCNNPNAKSYEHYGGRGIEFRFESFEEFVAEVGPRPSPKHSIDRIDNDGHYEPGNVRWATMIEQNNNRGRSARGSLSPQNL